MGKFIWRNKILKVWGPGGNRSSVADNKIKGVKNDGGN